VLISSDSWHTTLTFPSSSLLVTRWTALLKQSANKIRNQLCIATRSCMLEQLHTDLE